MGPHLFQYFLLEIKSLHLVEDNCQRGKIRILNFAFLSFFLCFFWACDRQDTISLTFDIQQSEQGFAIKKIHFFDAMNGLAMGGEAYQFGVAQSTENGGKSWTIDTVSQKIVRDFDIERGIVFGVGIDNFITRKMGPLPWEEFSAPSRGESHGILKTESGYIIVGGIALKKGFVILFDDNFQLASRVDFNGELNAIARSSRDNLHIVGFGQVYRSEDNGLSWIINAQEGDDYRDLFFVNENVGWIVGHSGSILKTEDAGITWETQNKPSAHNKLKFNSLHFNNELDGIAVGDDGLAWITKDGGAQWSALEDIPNWDFCSAFISEEVAWIGTEQGQIIRLFL